MQTVNLTYNVPVGLSLEEFVEKVNAYVARLVKKCQTREETCDYEPNEETIEAMEEARAWREAYDRGEKWAIDQVYNSVDDMMNDLMKA